MIQRATVAADNREFMEEAEAFEKGVRAAAAGQVKTAKRHNRADLILALLAPVTVAVATGLTTLSTGKSLAAGITSVAATAFTAAHAGYSPGRRAGRNWTSFADFDLIAGRAADLYRVHATYLSLEDAARQLDRLREQLAAAHRRPHIGERTYESKE